MRAFSACPNDLGKIKVPVNGRGRGQRPEKLNNFDSKCENLETAILKKSPI